MTAFLATLSLALLLALVWAARVALRVNRAARQYRDDWNGQCEVIATMSDELVEAWKAAAFWQQQAGELTDRQGE